MLFSSKLRHLHRNDTAGPPLSLPHHEGFFVLAVPLPQAKAGRQKKLHSLCRYKALQTDAQINLHFFCQMRWNTIGTMSKSMHSDYTDFWTGVENNTNQCFEREGYGSGGGKYLMYCSWTRATWQHRYEWYNIASVVVFPAH